MRNTMLHRLGALAWGSRRTNSSRSLVDNEENGSPVQTLCKTDDCRPAKCWLQRDDVISLYAQRALISFAVAIVPSTPTTPQIHVVNVVVPELTAVLISLDTLRQSNAKFLDPEFIQL
jgi:hypothetical protein